MSPDNDVKQQVKEILLNHRGADDPISSREINEIIDKDNIGSFPGTREIIRDLVMEEQIPIASGNKGYYVIEDEDELAEYLETLESRIIGIADRKYGIRRAAQTWDGEIETSEDRDIL